MSLQVKMARNTHLVDFQLSACSISGERGVFTFSSTLYSFSDYLFFASNCIQVVRKARAKSLDHFLIQPLSLQHSEVLEYRA